MSKSANAWLDEILKNSNTGVIDIVPKGWLTAQQAADIKNVSVRSLQDFLRREAKNGKLERKQFRIKVGRETRQVWHYKGK